ncbi:UDP-2,3-diacylglucosamine diphosphatase LpxI [Planctomycetota bacterium]|nr:UDP-2,3-diacylglucosamine diphosphatase LpxI [Planctomycetota bacterium]
MSQVHTSPDLPPVGLIAGQGRMPILEVQGMRAVGRKVACVGLAGQYDPDLPSLCDHFAPVGLVRIGQWCKQLRKFGAQEAVMIGRVRKSRMYDPLGMFRQIPDFRAAKIWYRNLRHDRRSQTLLSAVADEMENCGVRLIDSTRYIPEHMASQGVMTKRGLTTAQEADIKFAWPILMSMNDLEIGQAIAVKNREVIAVEAMEGTDAMIKRAGKLCRTGGFILLKAPNPNKDMRFDVPTVGIQTIKNLEAAGGACLVVATNQVIFADKPAVIEAANEAGITVVGV